MTNSPLTGNHRYFNSLLSRNSSSFRMQRKSLEKSKEEINANLPVRLHDQLMIKLSYIKGRYCI